MARAHANVWTTAFLASANGAVGLGMRTAVTVSNWLLKSIERVIPSEFHSTLSSLDSMNLTAINRGQESAVWDELDVWLSTKKVQLSKGFNHQLSLSDCNHHKTKGCNQPKTGETCSCCQMDTADQSGRCKCCYPKRPSCTHKPDNVNFDGEMVCYCCGLPFIETCKACPPLVSEGVKEDVSVSNQGELVAKSHPNIGGNLSTGWPDPRGGKQHNHKCKTCGNVVTHEHQFTTLSHVHPSSMCPVCYPNDRAETHHVTASSEPTPREYAAAERKEEKRVAETSADKRKREALVKANAIFSPSENLVLFGKDKCPPDVLSSASSDKWSIYLNYTPTGETGCTSNHFLLNGFDAEVQPGDQCGFHALNTCTKGMIKLSDFNKVLQRTGPYTDRQLIRMAAYYHINILIFGDVFSMVVTNSPGEPHYTIQHIKNKEFPEGHWRPCQLSLKDRWTDKLTTSPMFSISELDSLCSEIMGANTHYSTNLMDEATLLKCATHIKHCEDLMQSKVTAQLPQVYESDSDWWITNSKYDNMATGEIKIAVPGWAKSAIEPLTKTGREMADHLSMAAKVNVSPEGLTDVDSLLHNAITMACHDIMRVRLLAELEVSEQLKASFKIHELSTRKLSTGLLAINLSGTKLKPMDEVYIKELGAVLSIRVKYLKDVPYCVTPIKNSVGTGNIKVLVPNSSAGSAWRTIKAALTCNINQGKFNDVLRSMEGTSAVFGWGKSTRIAQEADNDTTVVAMTRGAVEVLKDKLLKLNKQPTVVKAGTRVMSAESASQSKVMTKTLIIDEASKLTTDQLLLMLSDKVKTVKLYGDYLQIGARDMSQTPGTRVVSSCLEICQQVDVRKHTHRVGQPLAGELAKIPQLIDLTCDEDKVTKFGTTTTATYDSNMSRFLVEQYQIDTVLTHYQEGAAMLKRDLQDKIDDGSLRVSTIDSFQGQESNNVMVVAMPTVRGTRGLIDDFEFNISAASRGKSYLHWWSINCHQESTSLHLRIMGSTIGSGLPGAYPDEEAIRLMEVDGFTEDGQPFMVGKEVRDSLEDSIHNQASRYGCKADISSDQDHFRVEIRKKIGFMNTVMATYQWTFNTASSVMSVSPFAPISSEQADKLQSTLDSQLKCMSAPSSHVDHKVKSTKCCHAESATEKHAEYLFANPLSSWKLRNLAYICQQFQAAGTKLVLYTEKGHAVTISSGGGCSTCGALSFRNEARSANHENILRLPENGQQRNDHQPYEDAIANSCLLMVGHFRGPTTEVMVSDSVDHLLDSKRLMVMNLMERGLTLTGQVVNSSLKRENNTNLENRYIDANTKHIEKGKQLIRQALAANNIDPWYVDEFVLTNKPVGHMSCDHLPWVYQAKTGNLSIAYNGKRASDFNPAPWQSLILESIIEKLNTNTVMGEFSKFLASMVDNRKVGARIAGLLEPVSAHKDAGDEIYRALQNFAAKSEMLKLKHTPPPIFMTKKGMEIIGDTINSLHPKLAVQEHNMTHGQDALGQARETLAAAARRRDRNAVNVITQRPTVYFVNSWFNSTLISPEETSYHKHWFDQDLGICYNVLSNITSRVSSKSEQGELRPIIQRAVQAYKSPTMHPVISEQISHMVTDMNDTWSIMTPSEIADHIKASNGEYVLGWYGFNPEASRQKVNVPGRGWATVQATTGQDIPTIMLDTYLNHMETGVTIKVPGTKDRIMIEKQCSLAGVHLVKIHLNQSLTNFYHVDNNEIGTSTVTVDIPTINSNLIRGITNKVPYFRRRQPRWTRSCSKQGSCAEHEQIVNLTTCWSTEDPK
nr:TPA_asm: RNA-dependent RNA polymerase [Alphaendornavirus fimbriatae-2]